MKLTNAITLMKALTPVIVVLGLIGVATVLAQTGPTNQKATEALENRIKALEQRVATLETLNARIMNQRSVIFVPSVTNSALSPSVGVYPAPTLPNPQWRPFEFNNETYYFIPLGLSERNKN